MVLELQKEVSFSKDFLIASGSAFGLFIHAPCKISCNFSCKVASVDMSMEISGDTRQSANDELHTVAQQSRTVVRKILISSGD